VLLRFSVFYFFFFLQRQETEELHGKDCAAAAPPPPSVLSLGKETRPAFKIRHTGKEAREAIPPSPSVSSTGTLAYLLPRIPFVCLSRGICSSLYPIESPLPSTCIRACCSCPAVRPARPRESGAPALANRGPELGSGCGIRGRVPRVRPSSPRVWLLLAWVPGNSPLVELLVGDLCGVSLAESRKLVVSFFCCVA
jgi:hypothetical protein